MMKKISILFIFIVTALISMAQNDIFILIDVSGNPLQSDNKISSDNRSSAIKLCNQLILGNISKNEFYDWIPSGLDGFVKEAYSGSNSSVLNNINSITVIPYGNQNTYKKFKIFQNNSASVSLKQAIDYSNNLSYTDQLTFVNLAHAKAADIAIDANIKTYYLIEIGGLSGDQTGSNGLSSSQQQLIDNYESSAIIESSGLFRLNNKPLSVSVKIVNIKILSGNNNTSGSKGIIQNQNINNSSLRFVTPIGTKSKYKSVNEGQNIAVSWIGLGAKDNTKYTVKAMNLDTKKSKTLTCIDCNNVLMKLEPGLYKITIRGNGISACQNNNQYVEVIGETSYGSLFFLLVILAIGAGALYVKKNDPFGWWNKGKENKTTSTDDNDSLY
ncbi:MAG: hypothetical protein COA49_03315 [Bacteroidetes bacterium]|nr:MAG: hypothetical protein COA49_03315 [Bacteroidota bacterium]